MIYLLIIIRQSRKDQDIFIAYLIKPKENRGMIHRICIFVIFSRSSLYIFTQVVKCKVDYQNFPNQKVRMKKLYHKKIFIELWLMYNPQSMELMC
jgi:hypothetical protein